MDKIKKHLKENGVIYFVVISCLLILGGTYIITKNNTQEEKVETVDTSLFKVVNLSEALKLFDDDNVKMLLIGYETCSATIDYVPTVQYVEVSRGFTAYYLDLKDNMKESEELDAFIAKLDLEYDYKGEVRTIGEFLGYTPTTLIIKNGKVVYAYIGSINTTSLNTISNKYGLGTSPEET